MQHGIASNSIYCIAYQCFLLYLVPAPPSNLSVSQNGLNSLLVSWMPSDGATNYIIYYKEIHRGRELSSKTLSAGANDTNITISLNIRLTYIEIHYVSIVAINRLTSREIIGYRGTRYSTITLRSPLAGPVNITLGMLVINDDNILCTCKHITLYICRHSDNYSGRFRPHSSSWSTL